MKKIAIGMMIIFCAGTAVAFAEPSMVEKDMDGDKRKETKVYYKKNNQIDKMVKDKNGDGKDDETIYFKDDSPERGESDSDFNGKIDTWTTYEASGEATVIAQDNQRKDGLPDYWRYFKAGKVYQREWDRNFDKKPDIRISEENGRFIEKKYDDNFDGKFEKTVKAPQKGSVLKVGMPQN